MYDVIISVENLLVAWREFIRDKRNRKDVEVFSIDLMSNIISLHNELRNKTYNHGGYISFQINDTKPRDIHKASVRDRLVHHAIYQKLYPYFDKKFIFNSYSCRNTKGTHRAINQFRKYAYRISQNHTRTVWVLKCDIKKFFANIDHGVLIKILEKRLRDTNTVDLLSKIISSFNTKDKKCVGLPLGNLTSQLLVNIYMNEFDHYIKRKLKIEHYIRYADDFIIISYNRKALEEILPKINEFLLQNLKLSFHPDKIFIKTFASGVDFLGWISFIHHRVLRTSTKRRMFRNLNANSKEESVTSYKGLISHGNTYRVRKNIDELFPTSQ